MHPTHSYKPFSWVSKREGIKPVFIFAAGTLFIGLLSAYISFSLFPLDKVYQLPSLYPPLWVFWLVWFILYPTMGMAAGYVWLVRKEYDIKGAMIFYASMLLANCMFLPVANLSNGNPAIMTLMDINGVFTSLLLGWLFSRYSSKAFLCLLPLLIWMPVTTILKISLWIANPL